MMFPEPKFVALDFEPLQVEEQQKRDAEFYRVMNCRRTVREFSSEGVPFEIIENVAPEMFSFLCNPERPL